MTANSEQARVWNEAAGAAWVAHAEHFDATLGPFGAAAIARLAPQAGDRVVDIGCGAGATTLRLAMLVAPADVVGVDLSAPMLEVARRRAEAADVANVMFVMADAQVDDLPGAPFDLAYSRFGVMFFSDPLRAFGRIADALVESGRMAFVCFQVAAANPFITAPVGAAMRALSLTPAPADGPSPFSLADPDATTALLEAAGFTDVEIEPGPSDAVLGADQDLHALAKRLIEQNPTTSAALDAASPDVRVAAIGAAAEVLAPHGRNGVVRMPAATWIVAATKR